MRELIICIGISGSGKSTWSANFIKENPNFLRINRDDIRKTLVGDLDGYYRRKSELLYRTEIIVTFTEDTLFNNLISYNSNIIIDNTNLKQSYINRWIELCREFDYTVNFKFKLFDISLKEAKENVILRENYYTPSLTNELEYHKNKVEYIDKQYEDYQNIKKYLLENYKNEII